MTHVHFDTVLNRYDLNGDGRFSGDELTPEMERAMEDVTNDAGRTLALITGLITCPIYSAFWHLVIGAPFLVVSARPSRTLGDQAPLPTLKSIMRPENLPLLIFAGLLALPSALAGFFGLLLALLFWEHLHFDNLWHVLVFGVTLAWPFLALTGYFRYLRRQTWAAFGLSLAGSATILLTVLLWMAPASRGLVH
jgi:hypothetical protein